MKRLRGFIIIVLLGIAPLFLNAAYFRYLPQTITQPDGTVIDCFASGDEFFNWYHDAVGYTIIQGSDGFYYYGEKNGQGVKPSSYRVNSVDPSTTSLQKWCIVAPEVIKERRDKFYSLPKKSSKSPITGQFNNISIFIRFSDQTEFTTDRSVFDLKFNSITATSLKKYYTEVSYNNLEITTTQFPTSAPDTNFSYVDSHPRAYYLPYDVDNNPIGYQSSEKTEREHTLLANAVNAISSQVPGTLDIDGDDDGFVDNICFIIRGGNSAWADLLWAHRWWLSTQTVYINGAQVSDYTFQPESQNDVQTLCHEMFHALGAPDLYHYSYDGLSPAGDWDLMESGFGHMTAFMKWKYTDNTWITTIPQITTSGTYTLHPLTSSTNNCYRIASTYADEFFVVEYRKKISGTFENNLPGSGLIISRIHEDADVGNGNADGPPDELYVYRAGGTLYENGNPGAANFSSNVGRTYFNNFSNPGCFLSDETTGGINIYNITSSDSTISFDIGFNSAPVADFSASRLAVTVGEAIDFTDNSLGNPTSWVWKFPGSNMATTNTHNPTGIAYSAIGNYSIVMKATNSHGTDTMTKISYIRVVSNVLDCFDPVTLTCGVPYDGNNALHGEYNVNQYSCTNSNFYGPEVLHSITLTEISNITASLSNFGSEVLYVIIADNCSASNCLDYHHYNAIYNGASPGTYYFIVDGYKGDAGPYRLTVTCTPAAGIADNNENRNFVVFPNPGSGTFTIEIENPIPDKAAISILNYLGQDVYKDLREINSGKNIFPLNVSELNKGVYFLRIKTTSKEFIQKLVIQ